MVVLSFCIDISSRFWDDALFMSKISSGIKNILLKKTLQERLIFYFTFLDFSEFSKRLGYLVEFFSFLLIIVF